jgi:hypothetical protein
MAVPLIHLPHSRRETFNMRSRCSASESPTDESDEILAHAHVPPADFAMPGDVRAARDGWLDVPSADLTATRRSPMTVGARVMKRFFLALALLAGMVVLGVGGSLSATSTTATQIATGSGDTTATAAFGSNVTAGDAIIVVVANTSDDPGQTELSLGVTDNESDTFTHIDSAGSDEEEDTVSMYATYDAVGGSTTISATANAMGDTDDYVDITAYEVPNVTGLDVQTTNSAFANTAITTGSVSTTQVGDFVVAGVAADDTTISGGSGWGDVETHTTEPHSGAEDQIQSAAGAINGTFRDTTDAA